MAFQLSLTVTHDHDQDGCTRQATIMCCNTPLTENLADGVMCCEVCRQTYPIATVLGMINEGINQLAELRSALEG